MERKVGSKPYKWMVFRYSPNESSLDIGKELSGSFVSNVQLFWSILAIEFRLMQIPTEGSNKKKVYRLETNINWQDLSTHLATLAP